MVQLHIESNIDDVLVGLDASVDDFPEHVEAFAQDAINIMTDIPRKYIPARHRRADMQRTTETATGRLWSGFGRRTNVQTANPDSSPEDNIANIEKSGDEIRIEVGTNVPYSGYVNIGVNTPEYLFTQRGNEEIERELEKAIEFYANALSAEETKRVGSSIRARGRQRDIGGRFLPF